MPLSLPIGIQTFRTIREEGYYYVDKTPHIRRLVEGGTHYFLSRPRRFGKSLLVDTLKELFEGNEALFEGLAIHGHWDWSVKCPVVRLSFGGGDYGSGASLREDVAAQLADAEVRLGVSGVHEAPMSRFRRLLEGLHRSYGERVVVLVDEYDKPILDVLDRPELARANRDFLRGLYGVIKDSDAHVRFAFVTGVSKFSKVSLFSGLNNLLDITLHPAHATICGYTDEDLDGVFAPELAGSGPGKNPRVVQRLFVAGRIKGVQPLRHPSPVRASGIQGALVRDGLAKLPDRHAHRTTGGRGCDRVDGGLRRRAVEVRRGRHRHRGAAVPDGLSDDCRRNRRGRPHPVSPGIPESRGEAEPERAVDARAGDGPGRANGARRQVAGAAVER